MSATVSNVALAQTLDDQLSAQENSVSQLEQQLASGQVLNRPSDDPAAVTQVLALTGQAGQLTSWQSNADTATSWLGTANNTANSVLESMQSAQTLLLRGLNQGVQDPTTYEALGDQLQGVVSNLLSLSNTQFEGRPIFAGTGASSQAYDASGNYLGNADVPTVVIGPGSGVGQTVGLSVTGTTMFGAGAASVFNTLSTVTAALLASVSSSLTTQIASIQTNAASLQDVNVATATTQLDSEMTNYQAALWAASQVIPDTLVKFLAP
jgi:flagellar hook-associated protein 3 FlgL